VRVIGEIEACRRVGGIAADVDAERANLPVWRDRPHEKEDQGQRAKEQKESELPAAAPFVGRVAHRHGHVFCGRLRIDQATTAGRNQRHLDRGRSSGHRG
jgi:hypothetical protein